MANGYDWSRLVAKVKLAAPLLQAIADRAERRALSVFLHVPVAFWKQAPYHLWDVTNGQS
jgi:hypothetical protein